MEEALHPFDHDLVISPAQLELYQEFLTAEVLESRSNLRLEVTLDRFGVLVVELGLEPLDLLNAEVVDSRIDFHVLLLREDHPPITRRQERLQRLESVLPQVAPLLV